MRSLPLDIAVALFSTLSDCSRTSVDSAPSGGGIQVLSVQIYSLWYTQQIPAYCTSIMAASQLQLPPDYYLTHFHDLLRVLQSRYDSVLLPQHIQLIEKFQQLPLTAQRLWVRLLNRKGLVFALQEIEYDEVPDQAVAVATLCQAGLLDAPSTAEDLADWLQRANKEHLLALVGLAPDIVNSERPLLKKTSTKPQIQ